jgi:uncharacterized protein (TIGR00369 family)
METLGFELLSYDAEAGMVEVAFTAPALFGNLVGNVQGGFQAAMLDAALGSAVVCTLGEGEIAPTLELKVSYLRPAPLGRLLARARILRRGRTVAFVAGELYDEAGTMLASATATQLVTRERRASDHALGG